MPCIFKLVLGAFSPRPVMHYKDNFHQFVHLKGQKDSTSAKVE